MMMRFSTIEDAIEAIARGQAVIVVDSEDRENEGDFLAAADTIDAQTIHLMITEGRGQLCVPVLPDIANRLQLAPMVEDDSDFSLPRFTIPLDHKACSTGISPLERAHSIRAMVDPNTTAADFIRPGHIFPLIARPGGVLERTGHTESAVDMASMAGLTPAGVLCEISSRDGLNMALRDELLELAERLDMPIVTIDALVEYRQHEHPQEAALLEMVNDMPQPANDMPQAAPAAQQTTASFAQPVPLG